MARLAILVGVIIGVAVGSGVTAHPSEASCIASIEWRATEYLGVEPPSGRTLPLGNRLGRARVPACIDSFPPPAKTEDTFARVRRVRGVPPPLAVFNVRDRLLYLARGYFPALPGHPLHGRYRGSTLKRPAAGRFDAPGHVSTVSVLTTRFGSCLRAAHVSH